ncbi:MAG: hypothetical protein QM790_01615 [Nibricoccus sp.]
MSTLMHMSLAQVGEKYRTMRERAFRATEQNFCSLGIRIRTMQESDAAEADAWPDTHGVRSWSWQQMRQVLQRDQKRFDVAVLAEGKLCAVCLGAPTRGKMALKLYFIESCPVQNPLRGNVLKIVFFAAHTYAKALGSLEVHIVEPASERLVEIYSAYHYEPFSDKTGKVTHMRKAT